MPVQAPIPERDWRLPLQPEGRERVGWERIRNVDAECIWYLQNVDAEYIWCLQNVDAEYILKMQNVAIRSKKQYHAA